MLVCTQAEGSKHSACQVHLESGEEKASQQEYNAFIPPPPTSFFSCIVREENPKRKPETSTFPTAISCLPALLHSSRQSAQLSRRNFTKKNLQGPWSRYQEKASSSEMSHHRKKNPDTSTLQWHKSVWRYSHRQKRKEEQIRVNSWDNPYQMCVADTAFYFFS